MNVAGWGSAGGLSTALQPVLRRTLHPTPQGYAADRAVKHAVTLQSASFGGSDPTRPLERPRTAARHVRALETHETDDLPCIVNPIPPSSALCRRLPLPHSVRRDWTRLNYTQELCERRVLGGLEATPRDSVTKNNSAPVVPSTTLRSRSGK